MIWNGVKQLYTICMAKKVKAEKAEIEANRLLDEFIEAYNELHYLIHHREEAYPDDEGAKAGQEKLERDFPDIFFKDKEVTKRLGKFVEFVNDEAEEDGDKS